MLSLARQDSVLLCRASADDLSANFCIKREHHAWQVEHLSGRPRGETNRVLHTGHSDETVPLPVLMTRFY
jgi:hypothetical protein